MRFLKISFYLFFLTSLISCSYIFSDSEETEVNPASGIISSGNLFISGGLFGRQEFEQYSLSGSAIFFECGDILRNGRTKAESSYVINLSESQKEKLTLGMLEIVGMASVNSKLAEHDPDDKLSAVILDATTKDNKVAKVAFGLRQVLSARNEVEAKLAELVSLFRYHAKNGKSSSKYCDNQHFYGLE